MAMDKRGAPRQFPFTLEQTQELFEQYKQETMENIIIRPCWPDFLTRNGISIEEAKEVINNPVDTNKNLSIYLKKALDWCTSQLMTHPGWGGNHAVNLLNSFGSGVTNCDLYNRGSTVYNLIRGERT